MAVLSRRRASPCLVAALAAGACAWTCSSGASLLSFVQPNNVARAAAAEETTVSRAEALRLLPALAAATAGASPSVAETGVTEAWKFRPASPGSRMRDEDDIHLGGTEWEDVKIGQGESPKIGDLVTVNFKCTAIIRGNEVVVDDTNGKPRDYTFGIGQLLPGIDEGMLGMKSGGTRKMRIPGKMAFGEKAIAAKVGRPAIPPNQPVEVEVTLEFIPGKDDPYMYGELNLGMS
eukprot:TRINITY_DN1465_c0_g2_i1.p1 TRINITY_DN1465_c0_g2~~TRINITY_DN1465_c0_g2_i1.p1  ORF type:complete len:233 (-),score=68.68 TRINITY_DN1465_c0_g2_i1:132-830(-)